MRAGVVRSLIKRQCLTSSSYGARISPVGCCTASSTMGASSNGIDVVVVLGSTGVGKSQLAVDIARKYNGEVISADAMQVYKRLDIITNKVTEEEMCGVPHHLLDFLDPLKEFTVVDFRNRALPILERLRASGKLAVIVGGTNYYIESLIWETLAAGYKPTEITEVDALAANEPTVCSRDESTESLYEKLQQVDPDRAQMLHPKDRRKIERSLNVFYRQNVRASEIFSDQRRRGGVSGGPLRLKNTVMFWIQCDQTVLNERLDARVDKMIKQGLIKELLDFHADYNARRGENCDYTQGIFQSIGFKEFHPYLIASEEERQSKQGQQLFESSLWLMKQVTKRYSKYQKKWITKRLLGEPEREVPPIYGLDGSDLTVWNERVRDTALGILDELMEGREPTAKPLDRVDVHKSDGGLFTCDLCSVTCVGNITWNAHLKSKKHRFNVEVEELCAKSRQSAVASGDQLTS